MTKRCAIVAGTVAALADMTRVHAGDSVIVGVAEQVRNVHQLAFHETGRWEHVRAIHDGRHNGASDRSYRRGNVLTLTFMGSPRRLTVHGITGPTGGLAIFTVDSGSSDLRSFYSPKKRVHAAVWTGTRFARGFHTLTIAVLGLHARQSSGNYVNVEDAELSDKCAPARVRQSLATGT